MWRARYVLVLISAYVVLSSCDQHAVSAIDVHAVARPSADNHDQIRWSVLPIDQHIVHLKGQSHENWICIFWYF